jgi:hypothetical protein
MMEETVTERQGMKHVAEEELGEEEDDASSTNQSVLSSRSLATHISQYYINT